MKVLTKRIGRKTNRYDTKTGKICHVLGAIDFKDECLGGVEKGEKRIVEIIADSRGYKYLILDNGRQFLGCLNNLVTDMMHSNSDFCIHAEKLGVTGHKIAKIILQAIPVAKLPRKKLK